MSHIPRERWYCLNCQTEGDLNQHGRCGSCDSDSVVSRHAERLSREADELERMFKLEGETRMRRIR